MVENRPWLTVMAHIVLLLGLLIVALPIWLTFVASTHDQVRMLQAPVPLWPGSYMIENYRTVIMTGIGASSSSPPVGLMMFNSLIMALVIALGKIAISIIAAYAIVYFSFPFRMGVFWMIFFTLMVTAQVSLVILSRL